MRYFIAVVAWVACLATSFAQDVTGHIEQLQKGSEAAKISAAMALAELGPKAAPAVAALTDALQVRNEFLRLNAAIALGKIGEPAVAPVAKLLKSTDSNDRYYALWTLAWIGPPAKGVVSDITQALTDNDANVRRKAAYALGRVAPNEPTTVTPLIRLLADGNADVRQTAAEALGKLGAAAVPGLVNALKDDAKPVQIYAAKALGEIGSDAKAAVEPLGALLVSPDDVVKIAAGEALAKIGKAAIPVLIKSLKSEKPTTRTRAVQSLGKIGGDAVPALVDALSDKQTEVRLGAATALAPLRVSDKMVVLALAHGAADSDMGVRFNCIRGLQMLGSGAKLAAPKLIATLKGADAQTKQQIAVVLQGINEESPAMFAAGLTLVKDGSPSVRQMGLVILTQQGKPALPHVIESLKDADPSVRITAVNSLQRIPGDIKEALPTLVSMVDQGTQFQKRNVVLALGRVGEPAVPALISLLSSDNTTRANAIQALGLVGSGAKKALPKLVEIAAKDPYLPAKRGSIQAVAAIDPASLAEIFDAVKKSGDEKARSLAYGAVFQRFGRPSSAPLSAEFALPLLAEAAKDSSVSVRFAAVQGSALYLSHTKEIVPILQRLAADSDARVRTQANTLLNQVKK